MLSRRMEASLLLAVLAHVAIFSTIGISASKFDREREYLQVVKLIDDAKPVEADEPKPDLDRPPYLKTPEKKPPEDLVVIPVPISDNMPRWIVDLIDRQLEEEPDEARHVNERPSKAKEEIQAEITSRDPKKIPRKRKSARARPRPPTEGKNILTAEAPKPRRVRKPRRPKRERHVEPVAMVENLPASPEPPGVEAPPAPDATMPSGSENPPTATAPETPQPEQPEIKPKPGTQPNLMPTFDEIAKVERKHPPSPSDPSAPGEAAESGNDPTESREDLPGVATAPDNFLPLVKRRGGITLLNAKSYKYSTFVRRVAHRIFDRFVAGFKPGDYRSANWARIQKGGYIVAIMNMNGRLVNVRVSRSTGDARFDSITSNAVEKGAWDSNVPEGAECGDGFVHFVFIPRVIPSNPTDSSDGRVYQSYLIQATAGISECGE